MSRPYVNKRNGYLFLQRLRPVEDDGNWLDRWLADMLVDKKPPAVACHRVDLMVRLPKAPFEEPFRNASLESGVAAVDS
jgi:hypothetical protein